MPSLLYANDLVSWCGVRGIGVRVQEIERAQESVAVLLNDMQHSSVIDFGCVGSRILRLNSNFQELKLAF